MHILFSALKMNNQVAIAVILLVALAVWIFFLIFGKGGKDPKYKVRKRSYGMGFDLRYYENSDPDGNPSTPVEHINW